MSDKLREAARALLCSLENGITYLDPERLRLQDALRAALATEEYRSKTPVAWIQHHKAGDNLVWDDPGGRRTPLYALAAEKEPRDGS